MKNYAVVYPEPNVFGMYGIDQFGVVYPESLRLGYSL